VAEGVITVWRDPRQWPPSLKAPAGLGVLALASAIAGHFVYRRFIIAVLIGALVGTGEIVSRYRDAPERALWTMSALLYILINAAASCAALYVIWRFKVAVTADSLRTIITQTLMAGFGAMAFFRTSLFIVRVGEQDVAIGPVAFLQVVLSATDRAVDRLRAEARAVSVTDSMEGVSFDRAWTALPSFCFNLMQNVPAEEQKAAAAAVTALKGSDIDNETKGKNLGLLLLNIVGTKVLQIAVNELAQQIRKTVTIAIVNAPYSMSVGQFADAHAECRDTQGNVLEGRAVTWSSDDIKVLTVTATGRVTPLAKGATVLRAVSDDATAAIRILVDETAVINIEDYMAGVSFNRAQDTLPLYCLNLTQNMGTIQQKNLRDEVRALAASPLDNEGKVINLGQYLLNIFGSGVLVAALKGLGPQILKTARITQLDPIPQIKTGDVYEINVACEDIKGNILHGRAATWTSGDTTIVKVSSSGSIKAERQGRTVVHATSDDFTLDCKIVVS
jgi:hypothetical protein